MAEMHHLDEGTIHAWLDGALPPDESARAEAHVATCAECSAMVAEARGLVAASSRILSSLDEVPAGVIPGAEQGDQLAALRVHHRAMRTPWWRRRSVLAAASVLFVAGMTTIVQWRMPGAGELPVGEVTARAPSASNEPIVTTVPSPQGPRREALTVSPGRSGSDQAAIASAPSAPPPSAGAASPAARADRETGAKRVPDSMARAREVATALADSSGAVQDQAQKVEQRATNLALPGQSVAESRNQSAQGQGLASRQAGVAAERTRQAVMPQAAPPVARTIPGADSVARAFATMATAGATGPAFTGGCFELRGPEPVGGPLLGVPGLVRLLEPGGAAPDTGWKPATTPDAMTGRTELVWRMIDAMTVELRVRRPLDSSVVVFRVVPAAPPLGRAPAGMQVAAAQRVVCR